MDCTMHSFIKNNELNIYQHTFRHHTYIIIGIIITKPHTKRKFYKN